MESEWISTAEAAQLIGTSEVFAANLARNGCVQVRRVPREEGSQRYLWLFLRSDLEERMTRPRGRRWHPDSPYVTATEARQMLGFATKNAFYKAVARGLLSIIPRPEIRKDDRIKGHRYFFLKSEVDAVIAAREPKPFDRDHIIYLAGLFDGEGSLHISKHPTNKATDTLVYGIEFQIANTFVPLMDWLVATFGGTYFHMGRKNLEWAVGHQWKPTRRTAARLLREMLPFLQVKREQAELAIEFMDHVAAFHEGGWRRLTPEELAWREAMRDRISALNGRRAAREKRHHK